MGFIEKIQARLEIYRLEKRYTRNRHRRSTFISNAMYVDGEYVYQTPNTTGSSTNSSATSTPTEEVGHRGLEMATAQEYPEQQEAPTSPQAPSQSKRLHRFSSLPRFGSRNFHPER